MWVRESVFLLLKLCLLKAIDDVLWVKKNVICESFLFLFLVINMENVNEMEKKIKKLK